MLDQWLPLNRTYELILLQSVAYECKPLILRVPRRRTLKVKHFFMLVDSAVSCPVFGLEIYVYLTFEDETLHRHIFVPKADTTGLSSARIDAGGVVQSLLEKIVSINPVLYLQGAHWRKPEDHPEYEDTEKILRTVATKIEQNPLWTPACYSSESQQTTEIKFPEGVKKPKHVRSQVSLFLRSADAYIFPKSEKNPHKHIADGHQLFRWWIRNIDKILGLEWVCKADIPGSDPRSIDRMLAATPRWTRSNIYVNEDSNESCIRHIPVFPDDPKGRFLEHLLVENRIKSVTSAQFWQELGFRQEFRLGNVVGIVGCYKKEPDQLDFDNVQPAPLILLRKYRRVVELIKGEDYSNQEDVQDLITSSLPETFKRAKLQYEPEKITGKMEKRESATAAPKRPAVNNLGGLVVKKKKKT